MYFQQWREPGGLHLCRECGTRSYPGSGSSAGGKASGRQGKHRQVFQCLFSFLLLTKQTFIHWGWDKMADSLQAMFWNWFSCLRIVVSLFEIQWNLFPRVQLLSNFGSDNDLPPNRRQAINTSRPRQNGRHFADDTFKRIFLKENVTISIKISLQFVPKSPIDNIPALFQIMAWRRPGDKPLSEAMEVSLLTHICVARPHWVIWRLNQWLSHLLMHIYGSLGLYGTFLKVTAATHSHSWYTFLKCLDPVLISSYTWGISYWYQFQGMHLCILGEVLSDSVTEKKKKNYCQKLGWIIIFKIK